MPIAVTSHKKSRINASELPRLPQLVNLILPGAGLILSGGTIAGLLIGALFAITAALAVASTLLIPDDFSATAQKLLIISAALIYIAAQILIAQRLRSECASRRAQVRRDALARAAQHLEQGDGQRARLSLQPLEGELSGDLLVALRWAQAVEMCGDRDAADEAWDRLRRMDRHHLYRRELAERVSRRKPASEGGGAGSVSRD